MKRSEGNVLLASPKHFDAIRREATVATIREGRRTQFHPGEEFRFRSNAEDDPLEIAVKCKRVVHMLVDEISIDDYTAAGCDFDGLKKVYPNLTDETEVTVIYFERL